MVDVGPPSREEPDPTGSEPAGPGIQSAMVALIQDTRGDGSAAVRYIQCDSCAGPTPHHAEVQIFSATSRNPTFVASPPEVVCGVCGSVHPRVVGDEPPRDTRITCVARRLPRLPLDRLGLERLRLDRLPLGRLRDRAGLDRLPLGRVLPDAVRQIRWPGACAHRFLVPAAAPTVICPRCSSTQAGPPYRLRAPYPDQEPDPQAT
jgi:hypothetical protein